MKKVLFPFIVLLLFACKEDQQTVIQPLTKADVNAAIDTHLASEGRFDWGMVNTDLLWTALKEGNHILSIGYGPKDVYTLEGENKENLLSLKSNLINMIVTNEKLQSSAGLSRSDIVLYEDDVLPVFDVFVKNKQTLEILSNLDNIRYLEPADYRYRDSEEADIPVLYDAGCSTSPDNINTGDYSVSNPNSWIPWNFKDHNIDDAWSLTTGSGITVGVIDTGISPDQDNFGSQFNSGLSSGRTISKRGEYVSSWWPWASPDGPNDRCGHGTSMAATIAAPRNGEGVPTGVAYNCNLITVRGTSDVVLEGYNEQKGVANSVKYLAKRSQLKVMSMSIGHIWSVGRIKDAIRYAYYDKGKMIVAAGGTSTSFTNWYGVIFPAWMNETIAVTGVTNNSNYEECSNCHKGDEIDFTVIMQRDNLSDRTSPVLGFAGNTANYVGGSSVATATTAGIAVLVWSRYPNWTRDQVFQRLKESGELYPGKSSNYGYGNIDALQAVQ